MAIVSVIETAANRGVSGRVRESSRYTRSFMVKTDSPAEPMANVMGAVGIQVGYYHPEDTSVIATEFDCKPTGDLLMFEVVWSYEAPPASEAMEGGGTQPPPPPDPDNPGGVPVLTLPADVWSGGTSVAAIPIKTDVNDSVIVNSAGVGVPDLQADYAFSTLSLVRSYATTAEFVGLLGTYTNRINSDTFAGAPPGTWKCQGIKWSRQSQSNDGVTFTYYSVTFEFAYDSRGWKLEQYDVGFVEKVSGELKAIVDSDGQPISDPLPLVGGVAVRDGTPPTLIGGANGIQVYVAVPFSTVFGYPV
jgi:hypothetical protein